MPIIIDVNLRPLPHQSLSPSWAFIESKWPGWKNEVTNICQINRIMEAQTPDLAYNIFLSAINAASTKFFLHRMEKHSKEASRAWWNQKCVAISRDVRRAYNTWQQTLLFSDKTILNRLEAIKKRTILKAKSEAWDRHISKLDDNKTPKKLWSFTKNMLNGRKITETLPNGLLDTNDKPRLYP